MTTREESLQDENKMLRENMRGVLGCLESLSDAFVADSEHDIGVAANAEFWKRTIRGILSEPDRRDSKRRERAEARR